MTYWEALLPVLLGVGIVVAIAGYAFALIASFASYRRRNHIIGLVLIALPVLAFIFGMPFVIMAGS